jgi:hypothetical protein
VRLLPQHSRYDFRPLPERKPYAWPHGARLAFTVTTNIEWFAFGAGLGHDALVDQFDEMLAQSERHALVMNVSLHPYVFGQPFRLRRLRSALRHCLRRPGVWYCRPREIAEHCYSLGERVT